MHALVHEARKGRSYLLLIFYNLLDYIENTRELMLHIPHMCCQLLFQLLHFFYPAHTQKFKSHTE